MKRYLWWLLLGLSFGANVAQAVRNNELWTAAALAEGHLDMCMAYAKGEWKQ